MSRKQRIEDTVIGFRLYLIMLLLIEIVTQYFAYDYFTSKLDELTRSFYYKYYLVNIFYKTGLLEVQVKLGMNLDNYNFLKKVYSTSYITEFQNIDSYLLIYVPVFVFIVFTGLVILHIVKSRSANNDIKNNQ